MPDNNAMHGLSSAAAMRQLALDGHKKLSAANRRTTAHIVAEVAREPMFLLLMVAGSIYQGPGDPWDAAIPVQIAYLLTMQCKKNMFIKLILLLIAVVIVLAIAYAIFYFITRD